MNHIKHGYLHVGRVLEVVRRVSSLGSLVSPVPVPARPSAAFWKVNNAISPWLRSHVFNVGKTKYL